MMKSAALFLIVSVLVLSNAGAEPAIFIVRHAEKVDSTKDPDLSEAGRTRSKALARTLKDASITAIYATEYKRTQQTAAPLAQLLGIPVTTIFADKEAQLVEKLRAAKGNALVVGHGNTVPGIIQALGLTDQIKIADNDYDNFFVVILGEHPQLIRLYSGN